MNEDPPVTLTCYVHEAWAPRIRPAGSKRQWMEDTQERYAYRCLPLTIANTHGWEILSPCTFAAIWRGGKGVEAVEIHAENGTPVHLVPTSLFGHGTITFHVEGIFRTSPGWNLWVGGAPNAAKDGIAPLGGVIETDWSPYTFTMNWRFTRPNHVVRWEKDEPFCFFFPVQRGMLDAVQPEIKPLKDAPELDKAFTDWAQSRKMFQEHVRRTKPTASTDQWQKLYYRGVGPTEAPGAHDHQTKLHLAPFKTAADSAAGCPVHEGGSEPPHTSPDLSADSHGGSTDT